nr:LysR family transcriptional regulator [Brucella pituitosa]
MEADLGIILFDRNTRGVRLTEAGRRFVDQVHDAMGILDHAIKTAGMQARGEEGELRIGVHALTTGGFLSCLLERFHGKYPNVRLHISEGTARDSQLMVREGKLDVAFMAGAHEIPDLNSRVIWRDNLMVGLPARHPLANRQEVKWKHLAEETFLVRHGGTGTQLSIPTLVRGCHLK